MSDKSFGDYSNKGVVKNPLLSSVVTGLSLEDLTQKAVLLPVTPTQGVIERSDHNELSSRTLAHSHHDHPNFPSGDADRNIPVLDPSIDYTPKKSDAKKIVKPDENANPTASKAPAKSDDDFDVNEYFARLQGTRYVSAPINSNINEDQSTEVEGNLEEINLNEPEKQRTVQQSLTSDIAHNFSQLPTVLPHVANTVFSSFSSMLNLKGKEEITDDSNLISGCGDDRRLEMESTTVPLMTVDEPLRNMGPPPKDPPLRGSGHYRITTKKKYAQIPGLTYDSGPNTYDAFHLNAPMSLPSAQAERDDSQPRVEVNNVNKDNVTHLNVKCNVNATAPTLSCFIDNQDSIKTGYFDSIDINKDIYVIEPDVKKEEKMFNIFDSTIASNKQDFLNTSSETEPISFKVTNKMSEDYYKPTKVNTDLTKEMNALSLSSTPILPPPPMFTNVCREHPPAGKSILPPSVARRLTAHHPIIKPQTVTPTVIENIFVPAPLPNTFDQSSALTDFQASELSQTSVLNFLPPSTHELHQPSSLLVTATAPITREFYNPALDIRMPPEPTLSFNNILTSKPVDSSIYIQTTNDMQEPQSQLKRTSSANLRESPDVWPTFSSNSEAQDIKPPPPVYISTQANFEMSSPTPSSTSVLSPSMPALNKSVLNMSNIDSTSSAPDSSMCPIFDPAKSSVEVPLFMSTTGSNIGPPIISQPQSVLLNPSERQNSSNESQYSDQERCNIKFFDPSSVSSKPSLPITEPPKATNSFNYRMTKKRPQYYSGPIVGVGAVSNSAKPVLPPVSSGIFEGVLFKPESQPLPNNNTDKPLMSFDINKSTDMATVPFDINKVQVQPEHNKGFDLSRETTEIETSEHEPKGFGIIGSLKSKLSSIDINKIQNSVTNFFDPGYNNVKVDTVNRQENDSYYQQPPYEQYSQTQRSSFEVFVPNIQHTSQSYSQENPYNQTQNVYNCNQSQKQNMDPTASYFAHPNHSITTQPSHRTEQVVIGSEAFFNVDKNDIKVANNNSMANTNAPIFPVPSTFLHDTLTNDFKQNYNHEVEFTSVPEETNYAPFLKPVLGDIPDDTQLLKVDSSTKSRLNRPQPDNHGLGKLVNSQFDLGNLQMTHNSSIIEKKNDTVSDAFAQNMASCEIPTLNTAKQEKLLKKVYETEDRKMQKDSDNNNFNYISAFQNVSSETIVDNSFSYTKPVSQDLDKKIQIRETNLIESLSTNEIPIVGVSSVPLFGLSTIVPEKPKDAVLTEVKMSKYSLPYAKKPYDEKAINKFFDNIPPRDVHISADDSVRKEQKIYEGFNIFANTASKTYIPSEFTNIPKNIVDNAQVSKKTSDSTYEWCKEINKHERDTGDLTTQLIENITAPIQLSNPIEAPFTESNTSTDRVEFDKEEFEKISHIVEDTIESIHAHSATELLDNIPIVNPKKSNFEWRTDNSTPGNEDDCLYTSSPPQHGAMIENNFQFVEGVISNVIQDTNNDNVSATAAAIPRCFDDAILRAESNIDVHSIELDANEEYSYIIEPSQSDDEDEDIIKEQIRFQDTGIKMESFTNRIERFKKRGESKVDKPKNYQTMVVHETSSKSSTSVHMASYFDTGNYAAETHYKNSLSSTSNSNLNHDLSSAELRIPPGFEDEYQRTSDLCSQVTSTESNSDRKSDEPFIPETSTQTSATVTSSYVQTNRKYRDHTSDAQSHLSNNVDDLSSSAPRHSKRPILAMIFGKHNDDEPDVDFNDTMAMNGSVDADSVGRPVPDQFSQFRDSFEENHDSPQNYNRLASYFVSSSNPDHPKSLFELSESENHYRHDSNENRHNLDSTSSGSKNETGNETDNSGVGIFNLMRDLTSVNNIQMPRSQTDKIINYFTVEYHNDIETVMNKNINNCSNIGNKLIPNGHKESGNVSNVTDDRIDKNNNSSFETEINCETLKKINFNNENETLISNVVQENDIDTFRAVLLRCNSCFNNILNIKDCNHKIRKLMDDSSAANRFDSNMTQTNEDARGSITVNFDTYSLQDDSDDGVAVLNETRAATEYTPVKHHWFYRVDVDDNSIWRGFSVVDSTALEDAYLGPNVTEETVVPTDGGRYDVYLLDRIRRPVYWNDKPTNVRRCSWFYKGTTDARYVPYSETIAEKLEEEFRHGVTTGEWHRQLVLPNSEVVVMHGPSVMVHFLHGGAADAFTASPQSTSRPRVVRRGHDDAEIEDPEPSSIDHLLLLCHGVGSACDMRFRNVEEVVDDFRTTSLQLVQSHYRNSYDNGIVNRVEVLPISWHSTLHSGENGVDRRLAQITLDSIPRLRNFTNDTVLDVLFYTSPVYCQTILDTVCKELNRIYSLFVQRNPGFTGGVSLGGHSLGSVILYDLLCHQESETKKRSAEKIFVANTNCAGQPNVKYPQLAFAPAALYALGSPIAIFECIRGVESLGMDFSLPTCKNFFNIFHPYDPIAYRIEPLINPQLREVKPLLVPHHKGRKRMHLELKETMVRVGADLKQKFLESIRMTWNKWKAQTPSEGQLDKVVEEDIEKEPLSEEGKEDSEQMKTASPEMLGKLNAGRRIDHVLQEAPLELINEYLFAMSSHVGYWESEDTMLLILREVYDALGVGPDSTVPQRTMTVNRSRAGDQDQTIVIDHPSTSHNSP